MNRVTMTTRLFAVAAVAAAFAGALKPHASSAQSPEAYIAACPSSATLPPPPAPPTDAQLQQWQTQFAQGLSQSLNVPLATVQNGLAAMTSPPDLQPPVAVQDPLVVASAQLGVSLDALRSAVQAADQTLLCPPIPGGAGPAQSGGNAFFIGAGGPGPIDTSAFFAAVAQTLGQGFTGQQVQSAFASAAPPLPDPSRLTADLQNQLNSLATALGVSSDSLRAALKSMAASGGCMPPNALGGFRLVTKRIGAPSPPAGAGGGPIIIPFASGAPPRLPGNPGDPLGLGLAPCGIALRAE